MPPYAIERVEEAETVPLIAWRGPVKFAIAKVVAVAERKSALVKCEVDDALIPTFAQIGEVVAALVALYVVSNVKSLAAPVAAAVRVKR